LLKVYLLKVVLFVVVHLNIQWSCLNQSATEASARSKCIP